MRFGIAFLLALAGCTSIALGQTFSEEEMLVAASALTKVTTAVEAAERYGNPPDGLADQAFLDFATAHDPALLQPLSKYHLKVLRKDRHAVLLLCDSDGQIALLEDVGCTAQLDRHRWKVAPPKACAFSVDPSDICPNSQ